MTAYTSITPLEATPPQWQPATWEGYLAYRDDSATERVKLFFHDSYLLVTDMGSEGINHAKVSDLFTLLFGFWFSTKPDKIVGLLRQTLQRLQQGTNISAATWFAQQIASLKSE